MMRAFFLYIHLLLVLLLVSCSNFGPIYNTDNKFESFLSSIEIEGAETIENADLLDAIGNLFGTSHDTKYILKIKLTDTVSPLIITERANILKQNVTQICEYSLIDKDSGETLTKGRIRLVGSYSSTDEPYVSYTHEKFTKKSITQTAAEELRIRMMMYFKNK